MYIKISLKVSRTCSSLSSLKRKLKVQVSDNTGKKKGKSVSVDEALEIAEKEVSELLEVVQIATQERTNAKGQAKKNIAQKLAKATKDLESKRNKVKCLTELLENNQENEVEDDDEMNYEDND